MFLEKYRDVPASDTEKGTLEQKHSEPRRTDRDVGRSKKQCYSHIEEHEEAERQGGV